MEYLNSVHNQLKINTNIEKSETLIFVGFLSNQHPENLIIKTDIFVDKENSKKEKHVNQNSENKKFVTTYQIRQLNQLDRIIAKELSNNARISFSEIAKQLKISTSNVIKRYHKLRKNNLLLRSTISVDLAKLGYRSRILIYFNIRRGTKISELQKRLFKIPNLIVLTKTLGQADMLAIFPVSTFEEFYQIKRTVYDISEIEVIQIDVSPTGAKWPQNLFGKIL